MKAGLIHDTYIEVFEITKEKKTHQVEDKPEVQNEFEKELSKGGKLYDRVA